MKNLKSLLFFYIGIFSISILLHSCCRDSKTITIIGGGDIVFLEEQDLPISLNSIATTLTGLPFGMSVEMDIDIAASFIDHGFMSPVYGISCDNEYLNSLDENTFSLSCNKDFSFNGENISAGTNFSDLDGISVSVDSESILVLADTIFLNRVEFINGEHEFKMSITTSDDLATESIGLIEIDM